MGGLCITRRSRGIHAAWYFWHAVSFSGKHGLRKVGLCGIHPLTRRYTLCGVSVQLTWFCSS
ncbi:DUF3265 domain-containing protein [Vibrio vulnificus]